ncbi:hypothetical protein QAA85_18515, partial [Serratia nevei]|uniref:hypothetical protein n=1 Tax=Serratia nevei TaxID=2703794 RepID=UPI0025511C45
VILVGLAIDQIAQSGLSSLSVIYYSAQLFRNHLLSRPNLPWAGFFFYGHAYFFRCAYFHNLFPLSVLIIIITPLRYINNATAINPLVFKTWLISA